MDNEVGEHKEKVLKLDENIIQAVNLWIKMGLEPGLCTELLLRGKYDEAYKHAHPLIKSHWDDHITYIEHLPSECRGENYDKWGEDKRNERNQ